MKTNSLSRFRFRSSPSDRVTDNRAQFELRWYDYQHANSPRQRRLAARRRMLLASYHETLSAVGGILLLAVIILCLFFI